MLNVPNFSQAGEDIQMVLILLLEVVILIVQDWMKTMAETFTSADRPSKRRRAEPDFAPVLSMLQSVLTASANITSRHWWVLHRELSWFDTFVLEVYGERRWRRTLRMQKESFFALLQIVRPALEKQNTRYRKPVPPEVRLAIILYRLGHGSTYFQIAEHFGVGESTVLEILQEGCEVIVRILGPLFCSWPDASDMQVVAEKFKSRCGLPNVWGAIDCTHVKIIAPPGGTLHTDYINRKTFHSIILQAVVDSEGRILDAFVGFPGRANDRRVLKNSGFYHRVQRGELLAGPAVELRHGYSVRPYILGDAGYTQTPWCMTPFPVRPGTPPDIDLYNSAQVQGRLVVEQVFGILKQRWRILATGIMSQVGWASKLVHSACILHNFLLSRSDLLEREDFTPPVELPTDPSHEVPTQDAQNIRVELARYLAARRESQ